MKRSFSTSSLHIAWGSCRCDIKPDTENGNGMVEHKDCDCFDGCAYCSVEYKLSVHNDQKDVKNITHFDIEETHKWQREFANESEDNHIKLTPFPNPRVDPVKDQYNNGILITKLKKDQHLKMICHARKGISKYHAKFMPVATALYNYQQIVELDREKVDSLSVEQKVSFIQSCPRKVFGFDEEDKVQVQKLQECNYCDECKAWSRENGKTDMVTVKMDTNMFHFTVEAITADGPRRPVDVVRAAMRILDYKMQLFLKDGWNEEITDWLPQTPFFR